MGKGSASVRASLSLGVMWPQMLSADSNKHFLVQAACLALCSPMESFHGMHPSDLCLCLFLLEEMRIFFSDDF
jgi:hypothetical protein